MTHTLRSVTDEQYGKLNFRLDELKRRVKEGTIPYEELMGSLQLLIENRRSRLR